MRSAARLALIVSTLLSAACGGSDAEPDAAPRLPDATPPSGNYSLAWTIADGEGAVTCAEVGASSVVLRLTPTDGSPGFAESFSCAGGTATSASHFANTYAVSVDLKSAGGAVLASVDDVPNVVIVANEVASIGTVAFATTRTGTLTFKLDVPVVTSNCKPNGAELSGVLVELRDAADACVPVTFAVGAGADTVASEFVVDCATVVPCIENDQSLTATVVAGQYKLQISGFKEGIEAACYKTASQLSLAGGDSVSDRGTVNVPADAANLDCDGP